jgi:hypothetical protein
MMSYCSQLLSMQIWSTSPASRSSFRDPGMRASVTLIIHEAAFYVVLHVFWCFINALFNNTFTLYAWRIYEFHVHTKLLCKCHYYAGRYGRVIEYVSVCILFSRKSQAKICNLPAKGAKNFVWILGDVSKEINYVKSWCLYNNLFCVITFADCCDKVYGQF